MMMALKTRTRWQLVRTTRRLSTQRALTGFRRCGWHNDIGLLGVMGRPRVLQPITAASLDRPGRAHTQEDHEENSEREKSQHQGMLRDDKNC